MDENLKDVVLTGLLLSGVVVVAVFIVSMLAAVFGVDLDGSTNPELSLRSELDFNINRDLHRLEGFNQAGVEIVGAFARNGFLDVSDGNVTVRLVSLVECQNALQEVLKQKGED